MIYDPVHGNIELSELESTILKSSIFNRLHQILQNSTAYLVFPSCKTSRFEHSLGVMNYSSELFINGLKNSHDNNKDTKNDIKNEFLLSKGVVLSDLMKKNYKIFEDYYDENILAKNRADTLFEFIKIKYGITSKLLNKLLDDKNACRDFNEELNNILGLNFIEKCLGINDNNLNTKERIILLVLLQTIRLFGLLHDCGHLPFSHVFEFAIEAVREPDQSDEDFPDENAVLSPSPVIEKINEIVSQKGGQIHEAIGKKIAHVLIAVLKKDLFNNSTNLTEDQKKIRTIIYCFIELCYNEMGVPDQSMLASLYEIVSGAVDSDRLDFIQRDGYVSGISRASGNLDRIVKMFKLTKAESNKNESFRFLPTFQSLHDVEKLLHDRFNIYKYMVNHHAVKRSDYVLQKNIEILFGIENKDINFDKDSEDPNTIIGIINIVHGLLFDKGRDTYKQLDALSQLTDYRLLTIFAQKYFEYKLADGKEKEFDFLSEIYESKRSFTSLWKRIYNYEDFLVELGKKCCLEKALINIDFKAIDKNKDYDKVPFFLLINKYTGYIKSRKKVGVRPKAQYFEEYKTIARFLIEVLINNSPKNWNREIEKIAQKKATEKNLVILVARTNITNGTLKQFYDKMVKKVSYKSNLLLVDNKHGGLKLNFEEMSLLPKTLLLEEDNAIKFFVYFKSNANDYDEKIVKGIIIDTIIERIRKISRNFATP